MQANLTTARLRLCPLHPCDLDAFHALLVQPGVRRYLLDGSVFDRTQAREMLERSDALRAGQGTGLWGIRTPHGDDLVGFAGLWPFHEPAVVELVYALDDARRGQGYATEAATAVLAYAHVELGWTAIRASFDAPNADSARVLRRLGFREVSRLPGGAFGDTVVFMRGLPP